MERVINTFIEGLNTDTDKSIIKNTQYIHAENFRLNSDNANSYHTLENFKGHTYVFTIGSNKAIYSLPIEDAVLLFCISTTGSTFNTIYRVPVNKSDDTISFGSIETVLSDEFGWTDSTKLSVVYRYENDNVEKVYFADGVNPIRYANLLDPNLGSYDADDFEMVPNVTHQNIFLSEITSGSLPTGMIQYSYQLYKNNGSETTFSAPSAIFHITPENDFNSGKPWLYKGAEKDTPANKGFTITIDNVDTDFDRIRVVSLFYSELNNEPVINIVHEGIVPTNGNLRITDTGINNLGTYTVEEFTTIGSNVIIASHLEDKDNILFAADIQEEKFEVTDDMFDARAYRFSDLRVARPGFASDPDNNYTIINGGDINPDYDLPFDHDCINIYNDVYRDTDHNQDHHYKYKADGVTLGGEGPNISYKFTVDTQQSGILPYVSETSHDVGQTTLYTTSYTDQSSPEISGELRSYQRGEIYRFGIVFFDNKGRSSFVKWIGDIRMPSISDIDGGTVFNDGTINRSDFSIGFDKGLLSYINVLGIQFSVNFSSFSTNYPEVFNTITGYQIVRAKRTGEDRTVLYQGMASLLVEVDTDEFFHSIKPTPFISSYTGVYEQDEPHSSNPKDVYRSIFDITSPEINFNKTYSRSGRDFVQLAGMYAEDGSTNTKVSTDNTNWYVGFHYYHNVYPAISPNLHKDYVDVVSHPVEDGRIQSPRSNADRDSSFSVIDNYNVYVLDNDREMDGIKGSHLLVKTTDGLAVENIPQSYVENNMADYIPLVNYRRGVIPYGGWSYSDRTQTEYIPASSLITNVGTGTLTFKVYRGDTFINWYDYMRVIWDNEIDDPAQEIVMFPVETSINLKLRHDQCYTRYYGTSRFASADTNDTRKIQETREEGLARYEDYNDEFTDLYLYNSVYSQESDTVKYFSKPFDFQTVDRYPARVLASEEKINGELLDNWTVFKVNNYLDVDPTYGDIQHLVNYNNKLLYFQDKAIGILAVNDRSLVQTSNLGQLALGTGDVLERYDYVTTNSGSVHKDSITGTPFGLFYYDAYNNRISRFINNEEPLSKIKNVNSILNSKLRYDIKFNKNLYTGDGVMSYYDPKYLETIFRFKSGSEDFTLSYNNKENLFQGYYTFSPLTAFNIGDYTVSSNEGSDFYRHHTGRYCEFYGGVAQDSKLSILVNPHFSYTKVFDSFSLYTNSINGDGVSVYSDTFNTVKCFNDYQNSGEVSLAIDSNVSRKERSINFTVPRNAVNINLKQDPNIHTDIDQNREYKERMRDKYLQVDLTYDNSNNNRFNTSYIQTNYRISRR